MINKIILLNKSSSGLKPDILSRGKDKWVYFGENYCELRKIEGIIDKKIERIDISDLLDDASKKIRDAYVGWIDELNRMNGEDQVWWFGSISSKNVYFNNTFQYCAYMAVLKEIAASVEAGSLLIFCEYHILAMTIKKWAEKNNIKTDWRDHRFYEHRIKPIWKYGKNMSGVIIDFSFRYLAAGITRLMYKMKELPDKISILNTFVHQDSIDLNGKFRDRYFPFLHERYHERNEKLAVLPALYNISNYFEIYKRMRKSETYFIAPEDYLNYYDFLKALYKALIMTLRNPAQIDFLDTDFSLILKHEHICQDKSQPTQAILNYELPKKMAERGIKPDKILIWYENQPIHRAIIAGARTAFKNTRIVGAQMYTLIPNLVSLFPSKSECEAKLVPDILCEMSIDACAKIKQYAQGLHCVAAASLRCHKSFEPEEVRVKNDKRKIFLFLPFNKNECFEMLCIVKDALVGSGSLGRKTYVKSHPDNKLEDLIGDFGRDEWGECFISYNNSVGEALKEASLVIGSSSGSLIESVVRGIKTIYLRRGTSISLNPFEGLESPLIEECANSGQLSRAIQEHFLLPVSEVKRDEEGKRIRDIYFTPVNEKTMQPLLSII